MNDTRIRAHALNHAFPGNALGVLEETAPEIPDTFAPEPVRAWVRDAIHSTCQGLPRPPVPSSIAAEVLETAHKWNLGAAVEREAAAAVPFAPDTVTGHVLDALRFDADSPRRSDVLTRGLAFMAERFCDVLQTQAWQDSLGQPEDARALRAMLLETQLQAVCDRQFESADHAAHSEALGLYLLEQATPIQRSALAPWLLRAGGAAAQTVIQDARDSFAPFRARYPDAPHPVVFAAARKLQEGFTAAAVLAQQGLPEPGRLTPLLDLDPLDFPAGARPPPCLRNTCAMRSRPTMPC